MLGTWIKHLFEGNNRPLHGSCSTKKKNKKNHRGSERCSSPHGQSLAQSAAASMNQPETTRKKNKKKNPRLYYFSFFFPCERSRAADCGAGCLPSEPSLHKEEKAKAELSQPSRPCSFSWLLPAWAEPKAQPQKSPRQSHCSLLGSFNPPWKSPLGVSR